MLRLPSFAYWEVETVGSHHTPGGLLESLCTAATVFCSWVFVCSQDCTGLTSAPHTDLECVGAQASAIEPRKSGSLQEIVMNGREICWGEHILRFDDVSQANRDSLWSVYTMCQVHLQIHGTSVANSKVHGTVIDNYYSLTMTTTLSANSTTTALGGGRMAMAMAMTTLDLR